MNNAELIITLTLIKGLGRKTINKIIRQGVLNSLETSETIDYLNNINLKIKGIITKDEFKNMQMNIGKKNNRNLW